MQSKLVFGTLYTFCQFWGVCLFLLAFGVQIHLSWKKNRQNKTWNTCIYYLLSPRLRWGRWSSAWRKLRCRSSWQSTRNIRAEKLIILSLCKSVKFSFPYINFSSLHSLFLQKKLTAKSHHSFSACAINLFVGSVSKNGKSIALHSSLYANNKAFSSHWYDISYPHISHHPHTQ